MIGNLPSTRLLLIEDFDGARGGAIEPDLEGLREQLVKLPGFDLVELTPYGRQSVFAAVPARNQRERDRLKAMVLERVKGWKLSEEQSYGLPKTF